MFDTIIALAGPYAGLVVFIAYVLAHSIQYLPISVSAKIPDFMMTILNMLAAKHGTMKAARTDIKGNVVTASTVEK